MSPEYRNGRHFMKNCILLLSMMLLFIFKNIAFANDPPNICPETFKCTQKCHDVYIKIIFDPICHEEYERMTIIRSSSRNTVKVVDDRPFYKSEKIDEHEYLIVDKNVLPFGYHVYELETNIHSPWYEITNHFSAWEDISVSSDPQDCETFNYNEKDKEVEGCGGCSTKPCRGKQDGGLFLMMAIIVLVTFHISKRIKK